MIEPIPSQIDLANTADFALGALRIRPALRTIETPGERITLEPRVMQVLVLLANHRGEVVTRDTMIACCWDGVIVGEDAIQRSIGRLRRVAETVGNFEIETLSRIGYRLIAPEPETKNRLPQTRSPDDPNRRTSVAFGAVEVKSAQSQDEEFIELLADDITAALSLNRDLKVAARIPSADVATDIRDIGQTFSVDYIATLLLRRAGDQVRLRVQLVETDSRRIAWTHSVGGLTFIGAAPSDDLIIDLASRLATELVREETDRALRKHEDLTAWEAVVRANAAYQRINLDSLAFAEAEARRAVALDPGFGAAQAALANALAATYELGGALNEGVATEARIHCDLALAADQANPTVLAWVSNALGMITRPSEGFELAERAIELAPTHPIAHLYLARHQLYRGDAEAALAALAQHDRVAPRFPWQYFVEFHKGLARFMAGQIDSAERAFERAALMNPDYPYCWIAKTIVYGLQGRSEDAAAAAVSLWALDGAESLDLQLARVAHSYPDPDISQTLQATLKNAWASETN